MSNDKLALTNESYNSVTPIILVPIYKNFDDLDEIELTSINQLANVLNSHPVALFGPDDIGWSKYLNFFHNRQMIVKVQIFQDSFFKNIEGYSKLLLSLEFYRRFINYSHLLIYQLDAYVFSDDLIKWCLGDYDYIGAPWIDDRSGIVTQGKLTGVGNGGLSLRRTKKFIDVLTTRKPFYSLSKLKEQYGRFSFFKRFLRLPLILIRSLTGWRNNGEYHAKRFIYNEDIFWGLALKKSKYSFNLPSAQVALQFSFEVAPEHLFRLNNFYLPFGCHAWFKYEPEFWQKYIN